MRIPSLPIVLLSSTRHPKGESKREIAAVYKCCGKSLNVNGFSDQGQVRSDLCIRAWSKVGPLVKPEHFAKKVTKQQIATLEVAKPLIAATATLGENGAKFLKDALNDNAQSSVPGWFSTVIGAVIPVAWIGSTADVMVQLLNSSGDAGRISLANLAGTVGNGGNVAVVHRIGKDAAGGRKYIWTYSYTANINGKPTTTLLYTCAADVIETA